MMRDAKARAREWLAEYQVFRDAQFKAGFADLVFEEVAERLNDFFEVDVVREAAHIVVGFDDGGFAAKAALYYVRVDGSLCQIVDGSDFLCFFLKTRMNSSPMILRFCSGSVTPASFYK